MNKALLNTSVQDFIRKKIDADIMSLLLKKPIFRQISNKELVEQIESKKKCRKKLPTWFNTPQIYYPRKLNIEQTSSELAAQYKAEIVSGKSLADLTGGFGVDSYFFAKKMRTIFYCEIDTDLAEIASSNFKVLKAKNVTVNSGDGLQFLKDHDKQFDWLFVDPSRRSDRKGKVFHLSDCVPDVTNHFNLFFSSADKILIKTAPYLDISAAVKNLQNIKELHIVAVNGEVKELLWHLKKNHSTEIQIKTVNISPTYRQTFNFSLEEEKNTDSLFHLPLDYIYEPNAAIMKSGGFKMIGSRFSLMKVHQHTHLYTSKKKMEFPGRTFKLKQYIPYNKKTHTVLKGIKANVATKNFPMTVFEIKKKHKIKDGGNEYLFFTTDAKNNLCVLHCQKIN